MDNESLKRINRSYDTGYVNELTFLMITVLPLNRLIREHSC